MNKKRSFNIVEAKIAQITENSLLDKIVQELKDREAFVDTDLDLGERIYNADVFEQILVEKYKVWDNQKDIDQLEELAESLGEYQYVMITMI